MKWLIREKKHTDVNIVIRCSLNHGQQNIMKELIPVKSHMLAQDVEDVFRMSLHSVDTVEPTAEKDRTLATIVEINLHKRAL